MLHQKKTCQNACVNSPQGQGCHDHEKHLKNIFFPSNVKVTSFKIGQGMDFGNGSRRGGKVREAENRFDSLFEPKGKG